jgi:beta-lactamase class A
MRPTPTRRALLATVSALGASHLGSIQAFAEERDRLAALEALSGGRLGVAGLNTGSGATVSHRADARFPFPDYP